VRVGQISAFDSRDSVPRSAISTIRLLLFPQRRMRSPGGADGRSRRWLVLILPISPDRRCGRFSHASWPALKASRAHSKLRTIRSKIQKAFSVEIKLVTVFSMI
jgi:hypothetical protein